ncbi:MAG: hypothetical protein AAF989_11375 [Planctomycetota bacterium]
MNTVMTAYAMLVWLVVWTLFDAGAGDGPTEADLRYQVPTVLL